MAIAAESFGGKAAFSRAVFNAQFAMGLDLSNDGVLTACLTLPGLDADAVWARSKDDDVKGALRRNTEEAQANGIFGAPSFTTEDGELFWGDDRLEQALRWSIAEKKSAAVSEG